MKKTVFLLFLIVLITGCINTVNCPYVGHWSGTWGGYGYDSIYYSGTIEIIITNNGRINGNVSLPTFGPFNCTGKVSDNTYFLDLENGRKAHGSISKNGNQLTGTIVFSGMNFSGSFTLNRK